MNHNLTFELKAYLMLSGVFLTSLVMANIVGVTKFLDLGSSLSLFGSDYRLMIPVGMLAYPITFLCTDLISEMYTRKYAGYLVLVGFVMNMLIIGILSIGDAIAPPPGMVEDAKVFDSVYRLMKRATIASMAAYLIAQLCDVYVYHFFKRITKGRHLWIRNNGSTIISQMIDTIAVITITFIGIKTYQEIIAIIIAGYLFKLVAALFDTPFMYLGVYLMKQKMQPVEIEANG